MLELLLVAAGIVGFGLAGYWDLKTTEFPDWLPYSMIIIGIAASAIDSFLMSNWGLLTNTVITGVLFLAIGLGMYFSRQWGDGDAWLLGAFGFVFPGSLAVHSGIFPFPVAMIFNFFIAAFIYIIFYSLGLSVTTPGAWKGFIRSYRQDYKGTVVLVCGATMAYIAFLIAMFFAFRLVPPSPFFVAAFPVLIAFVAVFSKYGMYIERHLFKRRIPVSKLRTGDVPLDAKWRCLKPAEVARLKRRGGYIWIKEGVRFAPVFLLAFLLTLALGDVFSLIFGLI